MNRYSCSRLHRHRGQATAAVPCTTPLEPPFPSSLLYSHSGQLTNTSIGKGVKSLMNISLLKIITVPTPTELYKALGFSVHTF